MIEHTPGKSTATRIVSVLDLVCLLGNACRGAEDENVGFEDAVQTIDNIIAKLSVKVRIREADIESCLWACNLLDERKKFWHPKELSFDQFIQKMLPMASFDKMYNTIEEKK